MNAYEIRLDFRALAELGWHRDREWQANVAKALGDRGWSGAPLPVAMRHVRRQLAALIGREPYPGETDLRWHISVSAPTDVPAWADMVRAAHDLRPGVSFVVGVPPRSQWMNVHPNVLHLFECRDEPLLASWRENARGDTPS